MGLFLIKLDMEKLPQDCDECSMKLCDAKSGMTSYERIVLEKCPLLARFNESYEEYENNKMEGVK